MSDYLYGLLPLGISGTPANYSFPQMNNRKILIIGIGGGNDATSACSIALMLRDNNPNAEIIYANCVSPKDNYHGFEPVARYLYRRAVNTSLLKNNHHTLTQMLRLPCDNNGSPFIIIMPEDADNNKQNCAMKNALNILNPDFIFALDGGGDSLTGGACPNKIGFDRRALQALQSCNTPFTFLVIGPGCDGESDAEMIKSAVIRQQNAQTLLGWFDLNPALDKMISFAPPIRDDGTPNTPNVMLDAKSKIDKNPQCASHTHIVNRHRKPEIPLRWLTVGIAFNGEHIFQD